MIGRVGRARIAFLAILGASATVSMPAGAAAQAAAVRGRVIDEAGRPLAQQQVKLHRVSDAGAGTVAQSVTDSTGAFELRASADVGSGIFFVTTEWQGVVQVGAMLRAPLEPDAEYVLQVGQPHGGLGAALGLGAEPPPPPRPAGETAFTIAALAALLASIAWIGLRAAGPSRRRRLLLRLARIDAAAGSHAAERERIADRLRSA